MADTGFDIDQIKSVLREATVSRFSQRSLSAAAREGRDCVGDILNDRNRNPTSKVLANLARALGGDLSMFGLAEERADPPSEAELEAALLAILPGMPRGALDKRARYLAENVGRVLRLPPVQQSAHSHPPESEIAEDAPPRAPTN